MPIIIFQSLIILFAFATIVNTLKMKQKGTLGIRGAVFWIVFWVGVAVVVIWPQSVQMIADSFGIGRGSDFVLYISVIMLFFLVFRLHIKIENMNRDVTKVVRAKSLERNK